VGREEVLKAIRLGAEAFARGEQRVHLFAFGPAGSGASHLLALMRSELSFADVPVAFVPDDLPILGSASRTMETLRAALPSKDALLPRCLVLFDGFERQLMAMVEIERRRLRQALEESRCWVIATGRALPAALTSRDTAFYGQFSPWPLPPLPPEQSAALLAAVAGHERSANEAWPARRDVLVALACGHPRSLTTMGQAAATLPHGGTTDVVCGAVAVLAADHRARFRALSPLGQQLIYTIATAAGPRTPGQLAEQLAVDPRVAATAARRLAADGLLRTEREGKLVYYEIVDSLFRIWSETAATPWPQSRIHEQLQRLEASLLAGSAKEATGTTSPGTGSRTRRHIEGQMLADLRTGCLASVE
jgi:DNA-binding transcriptional ArsR family regulator